MASSIINSDDGVVSGTSGLKTTGGDDGVLVFQSKGTETARINTDSQIVAAAGTASLPIYSTTGDVNTGIYFPAADNIAFTTGGTIRGRWTTDGLCFGSDTAAANALDDYEEGTFTVSLSPETGALTTASSSGNYIKIGKLVYVHITILITTVGTASGYLNFTGLPFSVQNSGGSGQIPLIVRETANTGTMYGGFLGNSATDGRLHGFANSTTTINMSNGNRYNIAACYAVA
jgi:hypothetical protein